MRNLQELTSQIISSLTPISSIPSAVDLPGEVTLSPGVSPATSACHGFWRDAALSVPAGLFVLYLAFHARKNLKKLTTGRSYTMIAYYALLWSAALLNLAWCSLQAWQCSSGRQVVWSLLSLSTSANMLCLEISLVPFLLKENYTTGLETSARTFTFSGIVVGADMFLKALLVFGFGIPVFIEGDDATTHTSKWVLWTIHKLLLGAVYGYILFVHYSTWSEKLPPRPAFYNYVAVMFIANALTLVACGFAGIGATFGLWLYSLTVICYHCFYLPFLYFTFSGDVFQEDALLLDNAYYSEMKDAGFFDADWE